MRFYQSFIFKFLMLLVAMLLLVVTGSGWFFLDRQNRLALDKAAVANETALKVVHTLVGSSLSAFGNNLTLLATVPVLSGFDPVESARYLKSYKVSGLFIAGERLALYNNANRLVSDNSMVGLNVGDSVFSGRAEPLRPYVGPLRWWQNAPVKPFAVTVQNLAKANGTLVADYSFKRIWPKLADYRVGEKGYAVLIDAQGTLLFHPDVAHWLATPTSVAKLGLAGFDPVRYKSSRDQYVRFADGEEYLVSYLYEPEFRLGVLVVQPRSQIEGISSVLLSSMLLMGSLVFVATLLAALWLHTNIGRPLQVLMGRVKLVHDGNLDDVNNTVARSDELGLFATEFDQMRISLRNSIRELANHKEQLEETVKARTEALQRVNRQLKLMSHTDHLTGIPNRRDIMEKVHYEMFRAERTHKPFSFLFADIDKFKNFNDTYGHECGDVVLKTVAQVVRSMLRKPDYIARWGGEEFLVVLPETALENAVLVAERIRAAVAATEFSYAGHIFKVTITLGVSLFDARLGIEHSINLADRALYRGKEAGRNRVDTWNPDDVTPEELLAAQKMREERGGSEFPVPENFELEISALGAENEANEANEENAQV